MLHKGQKIQLFSFRIINCMKSKLKFEFSTSLPGSAVSPQFVCLGLNYMSYLSLLCICPCASMTMCVPLCKKWVSALCLRNNAESVAQERGMRTTLIFEKENKLTNFFQGIMLCTPTDPKHSVLQKYLTKHTSMLFSTFMACICHKRPLLM